MLLRLQDAVMDPRSNQQWIWSDHDVKFTQGTWWRGLSTEVHVGNKRIVQVNGWYTPEEIWVSMSEALLA